MLSLPPIALDEDRGEYEIVFPCPTAECIRLLAWCHGDRALPALKRQLLENPSLLIHAAISYSNHSRRAPSCADSLTAWFADQVVPLLERIENCLLPQESPWEGSADRRRLGFKARQLPFLLKPLRKYLAQLIGNRDQQKLLKSIRQFLERSVDCPQPLAKRLVAQRLSSVVNSISAAEPVDDSQSSSTAESCILRWLNSGLRWQDFAGLMQMHRALFDLRAQFDDRLQTEKLASLQQLAYGASHEINNPLANIATRAQTLLVAETNPDRRSKLGSIYEQALRSHEMISDLMLFANPPSLGYAYVGLREFLSGLIKQTESRLDARPVRATRNLGGGGYISYDAGIQQNNGKAALPTTSKHPIHLLVVVPVEPIQLNCDPVHLNVALMALIQNSVESIVSSGGSIIELRVSQRQNEIRFEVTDDGQGIPTHIQRHLFDPFFSGREAGRGLGFGLSKAWRIARLHGGSLVFDRDYRPGAKFVLKIRS